MPPVHKRLHILLDTTEENPGVSEAWVYLGMLRLLVKRLARAA
jgi:hypothetical protein